MSTRDTLAFITASHYASQIHSTVILITGVSQGGVAFEAARALAKEGAKLILTGRSKNKVEAARIALIEEFSKAEVHTVVVDLSLIANIEPATAEINHIAPFIDVIINNAGVWTHLYQVTAEGHELQFVTNYLSAFLLTNLILTSNAKVNATRATQVVNITSGAHVVFNSEFEFDHKRLTYDDGKNFEKWDAYGRSKTGLNLMARELGKRWQGKLEVKGVVADPALVYTPIISKELLAALSEIDAGAAVNPDETPNLSSPVWSSTQEAGATYIVAAFEPSLKDAAYIFQQKEKEGRASSLSCNDAVAKTLWDDTEKMLGVRFP